MTAFFTFHYVSILIADADDSDRSGESVYIPLCLYFNQDPPSWKGEVHKIYIPLCLYFNWEQFRDHADQGREFTFHYVSILIYLRRIAYRRNKLFTFHYVSILIDTRQGSVQRSLSVYIPLCLYFNEIPQAFHNWPSSFTFHYVSILISRQLAVGMRNLSVYIPLCLYFNCLLPDHILLRLTSLHSIMSLF